MRKRRSAMRCGRVRGDLGRPARASVPAGARGGHPSVGEVPVLPGAGQLLPGGLRAVPRHGRGEVAQRDRAPLLHDRPPHGARGGAAQQRRVACAGHGDGRRRPRRALARWRRPTWRTPATCRPSRCAADRSRSWPRSCRARGATSRSPNVSAAETTSEHPVYAGWIAYFSLPANVEMVAAMRRDFDALVAEEGLTAARRGELGQIFATSSRLEHGFWEMAYTMEQWFDLEQP